MVTDKEVGKAITDLIIEGSEERILSRDNLLIRSVYKCSELETKILLQALYDVQHKRKLKLSYTADQIARLTGTKKSTALYECLKKAVGRLLNNKIILHDEREHSTIGFVIVPSCSYRNGVFRITINSDILPYLLDIKRPYTSMDMDLFCRLGGQRKSKNFELRLYEILKTKLYNIGKTGSTRILRSVFPIRGA